MEHGEIMKDLLVDMAIDSYNYEHSKKMRILELYFWTEPCLDEKEKELIRKRIEEKLAVWYQTNGSMQK